MFPFYDGFESGNLGTGWSIATTYEGRVRADTSYPYQGAHSVLLDGLSDGSTDSYASAVLTIDLSGRTNAMLDFWWREFEDENDAGDGVFVSDDNGATWFQVFSFNNGPDDFRLAVVDIGEAAASNGLTLNDHFQIRFQFQDEFSIPIDGYAIDEVRVYPGPTRYSIHLPAVLRD